MARINTRDLTQTEIHRLFDYDTATGDLIWRERPRSDFKNEHGMNIFNSQNAGKVAGSVDEKGYRIIGISGKPYKSHRIIWILYNGLIPEGMMIDHINNDPLDNRICNLRLASRSENMRNRGAQSNNTTGVKGVSFHKASGKYMASICIDGKQIYLGLGSLEECAALYAKAANKHHGEFARIA